MKLGEALDLGYYVSRFSDKNVLDQDILLEFGILTLTTRQDKVSISLEKEVSQLPIRLEMRIQFNVETADALMIGDVAPLSRSDIVVHKKQYDPDSMEALMLSTLQVRTSQAQANARSFLDRKAQRDVLYPSQPMFMADRSTAESLQTTISALNRASKKDL